MNKHIKWFVVVLVVLLVSLIIAMFSFFADISKDSSVSQLDSEDSVVNANGNQIFLGDNDLYGVKDSGGNILLDAAWEALQFLNEDYLLAVLQTADGSQTGVIDLDGNIIVPFVYAEIQALTSSYFLAVFSEGAQYVLYNSDFHVIESTVWDAYSIEGTVLTMTKSSDLFTFAIAETGLELTKVSLQRNLESGTFEADLADETAALSVSEWIYTADCLQKFLEMLQLDDFTDILEVTDQSHETSVLSVLTQEDWTLFRLNQTIGLSVSTSEDGVSTVTWQVSATVRDAENHLQKKTMLILMKKNQQETWVITELQFS